MDVDAARFLTGPEGTRLLAAARESRDLPPHRRAERLRKDAPASRVRVVLAQDDLRRRAAARCPHAEVLLFTRGALEQASAWPVAAERAGRWPGPSNTPLADLGAGIGLDALAAALHGHPVEAWERDEARALLLGHNAEALGVADRIRVRAADVETEDLGGTLAWLDPDRRPGGVRIRAPDRFEPHVARWPALVAGYAAAMVKLPPALDDHPLCGSAFEIVSLAGRLRERRIFLGEFGALPARRALRLPEGTAIEGDGAPWPDARACRPGAWLLDPDPSVTVADLVGDLAARHDLAPVHPAIAYLTGDRPAAAAPGHWIHVEAVLRPRAREVNAWLRAHDVGRLTIRTRGVADDVAAWRRRLSPRGHATGTVVFTRTLDDRWICLAGRDDPA